MKAANYLYLEFILSFDNHSNLTKVTEAVKENSCSYRELNFFIKKTVDIGSSQSKRIHDFGNASTVSFAGMHS